MGNKVDKLLNNDTDNMDSSDCKTIDTYEIKEFIITVKNFMKCTEYLCIEYEINIDGIQLRYDNPNFMTLYNKIKIGYTYKFVFRYDKGFMEDNKTLIDIIECEHPKYVFNSKVLGFLRLDNELEPDNLKINKFSFENYERLYFGNGISNRIIHKDNKKDLIIGENYKFTTKNLFGTSFSLVTDYELIDQ